MPERRTIRALTKELLDNPFFPLLFIAEFVKQAVQSGPFVIEHGVLAAISTVIWILSDAIVIDTEEIVGGDEES